MLFTGDVGAVRLRDSLKFIPTPITVLKVPHHGAIGGIDQYIIKSLNPKISIISVGENKFGHPAQYTLELIAKTKLLRTDVDNSILIKINKKGLKVFTYDLKKRKYLEQLSN